MSTGVWNDRVAAATRLCAGSIPGKLREAYRSWPQRARSSSDAVKHRWQDDMCAEHREPLFFIGDQHRYPGQFLVLGSFYPERRPDANQLSFELAA